MKKVYAVLIASLVVGLAAFFVLRQTNTPLPIKAGDEPLKIGLTTWVGNGPFYVAKAQNFFHKENVKVEFVSIEDTGIGRQLLSSGKIDAFYLTPETVVNVTAAGVPVKVFAATDRSNGADGLVTDDSIKTIADLNGKTVAFEVGSPSHFFLSYLLRQAGLSTKNLKVVNQLASDAGAAFIAGKVPAAVTWEPYLSRAKELPGGRLLASSKDAPVVYDMLIFRKESANKNATQIKSLYRALFEAREWIYANPDEAAKIIAAEFKITPAEAADQMSGVYWLSYEDNLKQLLGGEYSVKNALTSAAELWQSEGITKTKADVNNIIDDSILINLYK